MFKTTAFGFLAVVAVCAGIVGTARAETCFYAYVSRRAKCLMRERASSSVALVLLVCGACESGDDGGSDTSSAWFTFGRKDQGSLVVGEGDKRQYEFISSEKKRTFSGTFDAATVSELEALLDPEALDAYYEASAKSCARRRSCSRWRRAR